jgi:type I restriction enzyme M protein
LLIVYPPLIVQGKFVNTVNQSYEAEDKSKQPLEIFKTGAERAIETNEATGTIWINEQLEALNIKFSLEDLHHEHRSN